MHQNRTKPEFDKLNKWINRYDGFFTSKHARLAGYSPQNQAFYRKSGQWEKHGSGLFRYKYFPQNLAIRTDLIVPTLWSSNREGVPQGVISHDTALAYYKLSTWIGNGIHMTVPENFRRRALCKFRVRLHFAALEDSEIEDFGPFKVTTPLRTLLDVIESKHIEKMHVVEAVSDALQKKLVSFSQLKSASINEQTKVRLAEILCRLNHPRANEI